jgi:hypothetical protein
MEDIFRGQRAAAPAALTAKLVTAFRPVPLLAACGGSVLRAWSNYYFRLPYAENRTFP